MKLKQSAKWALAVGGLAVLILGVWTWMAPEVSRGPYLQESSPTSVIIRWRTSREVETKLRYGVQPGRLENVRRVSIRGTDHAILLAGLTPATRYYYRVEQTRHRPWQADRIHSFVTAPDSRDQAPVRVWVLGDSGTGSAVQRAVRDAFYRYSAKRPANLCLMLGDNAYGAGTEPEYQQYVFDMYGALLSQVPLWPTVGNHDVRSAEMATQTGVYFDVFNLPTQGQCGGAMSGTEAYYGFDYANVHFVCLDSEGSDRSPGGPMLTWLKQDLQQNQRTWTIAYWHQAPYSKGSHDSDAEVAMEEMRHNVLPILEAAGVDLVLSGHSHDYERSFLIDGHYGTSDTFSERMLRSRSDGRPEGGGPYEKPADPRAPHAGTVYVVAGSSGQVRHLQASPHPAMCVSLSVAGSLVLDVEGARLGAAFLDGAGHVRDQFAIVKASPPADGEAMLNRAPHWAGCLAAAAVFSPVSVGDPVPAGADSPPVALTADAVVADVLQRNLELDFYRAEIAAARAGRRVSGQWNNPEPSAELGNKRVWEHGGATLGDGVVCRGRGRQPAAAHVASKPQQHRSCPGP